MTYQKVVQELESRGIMPHRAPSLEPTKQGLQRLAAKMKINPQSVIVVAGTNGKGSVCASLEALLIAAGETVGLYTSPHLEETTERIRIQGQDISRELFCEAYQAVLEKTSDLSLSHFEILTLMAAWIFFSGHAGPPVQRAIFEVGLGGTWDSTNAIPHATSVITSLGFDHQNLLGSSLTDIARNKFGIVHKNNRVIHANLPPEVIPLARNVQAKTNSHWRNICTHRLLVRKSASDSTPRFSLETEWGEFQMTLPGPRAAENSALALTVFHELGHDPKLYPSSLLKVRWPGRMERLKLPNQPCPIFLSGDHNPQGAQSLLDLLKFYSYHQLHLLVGIGKDKDLNGILELLVGIPGSFLYLTEAPFKGLRIHEYGEWRQRAQGCWSDPMEALTWIQNRARPDDLILVTGSLYLVGQVRRELLK